jgi:lysozyme
MKDEGFRLDPYLCPANHWTGGVGHKMTQKDWKEFDLKWSKDKKLTYWTGKFTQDLDQSIKDIIQLISDHGLELNKDQMNVLVNMRFNLGLSGLKGFKKMLAALSRKEIERAAEEMLDSKWHRDFVKWNDNQDTEELRSRRLANQLLGVV